MMYLVSKGGTIYGKGIRSKNLKCYTNKRRFSKRVSGNDRGYRGSYSRYVSGERDPKPEMIANIATALHTTSDYLLGIEKDDFDYPRVRRLIARNASSMTELELSLIHI